MQELTLTTEDFINLNPNINLFEDIVYLSRIRLKRNESIKSKVYLHHQSSSIKTRFDFRFVLFDNSDLDIEAVVGVSAEAENVDTYLSIRALVVGEKSRARVVPSIEISQNQVKGGHGATVGYLDEVSLNYLYSRGLSKSQAEEILIEAFLS